MKNRRQRKIIELIQEREIDTQDALVEALQEAGFPVTQATISRDIKELRLVKVATADGKYKYAMPGGGGDGVFGGKLLRVLQEAVLSMEDCENLLVIKTISGSAPIVGEAVDSLNWPEIKGTIAGDDTVFLAIPRAKVPEIRNRIRELLGETE